MATWSSVNNGTHSFYNILSLLHSLSLFVSGLFFPYPARNFVPELLLLVLLAVLDGARIFMCKTTIYGNRCNN